MLRICKSRSECVTALSNPCSVRIQLKSPYRILQAHMKQTLFACHMLKLGSSQSLSESTANEGIGGGRTDEPTKLLVKLYSLCIQTQFINVWRGRH